MSSLFLAYLSLAAAQMMGCPTGNAPLLFNKNGMQGSINGEWVGELQLSDRFSSWEAINVNGGAAVAHSELSAEPVSGKASINGKGVEFAFPGRKFVGSMSQDGLHLTGSWQLKNGQRFKLELVRHPQTPVGPYPYTSSDVTFRGLDGHILPGTLTLPFNTSVEKRVPAVVLAVGSFPADRDYVAPMGAPWHRPYAVLADDLTRHGIAVLRFDQRGTGRSDVNPLAVTEAQIESDLDAAIAYLASRPEVIPAAIGIVGHSAGGTRAIRLMAKDPKLAFAVLLATPATPLRALVTEQARKDAVSLGWDLRHQNEHVSINVAVADAAMRATSDADAAVAIHAAVTTLRNSGIVVSAFEELQDIAWGSAQPYRFLLNFDPLPDLAKARKPMLIILPGEDERSDSMRAAPLFAESLRYNQDTLICTLPGLDHNLRAGGSLSPGAKSQIAETINPVVLRLIDRWILMAAGVAVDRDGN